jgi:hypothetical protein
MLGLTRWALEPRNGLSKPGGMGTASRSDVIGFSPRDGLRPQSAGCVRQGTCGACVYTPRRTCSSLMVGWKARSVCPTPRAASARPLGPNTSSATTPITKASGAPTPNTEACRRQQHALSTRVGPHVRQGGPWFARLRVVRLSHYTQHV